MKFGDVLRREREKIAWSVQEAAQTAGLTEDVWLELESGLSQAEHWGPVWGLLAVELEVPCSRLLSESGLAADCVAGQAGRRVARFRSDRGLTPEDLAASTGLSVEELAELEEGRSPLEWLAPRLLAVAEAIGQPVFNVLYPGGIPFRDLDRDSA